MEALFVCLAQPPGPRPHHLHMAGASTYLANKILDHMLRDQAYTTPDAVYLALHTEDPTDAGTGAEVTGGSYARAAITFAAASAGAINSSAPINITDMPAATVTHWSIWDASTGGNMLSSEPFGAPLAVTAGQTVSFASGDLTVTVA